jgi:hypothetical protein
MRRYVGFVVLVIVACVILLSAQVSNNVTVVGAVTLGDCTSFAAQTQIQDAGAPCGTGSGGIPSVTGTANQIDVANGTTTPVLSLDSAIILPGSLTVPTGASIAASGTGVITATAMAVGGLTGLGTGVGSALVVATNATGGLLTYSGAFGTPTSITLTNATGLPVSGLTGLGTGVATALGNALNATSGLVGFSGALGTPTSGTLTNATGLPIAGITGLGTGVATALGDAANASGGFVTSPVALTTLATQAGGTILGNFTGSSAVPVAGNLFVPNPQTTTYQATATDFATCKVITTASASFTITLLATAPAAGQCLWVIDYGTGQVTIAPNGNNINGSASNQTLNAGVSAAIMTAAFIVSNGTNYFEVNFGQTVAELSGHTFASPAAIGSSVPSTGAFTTLTGTTFNSTTNCSSSASPAVCGSAASGSVALPTGTNPTLVVNTSAVTANSQIMLTVDESLGTKLGVTCNTTLSTLLNPVVTARTGGTSFTFTIGAIIATNPACVSYTIIN